MCVCVCAFVKIVVCVRIYLVFFCAVELLYTVRRFVPRYIVYGSMGLEYGWKNLAFLRMGTHLNHDTAGLSLGVGGNIRLGRMMLTVDYAYVDYDILKYTNQVAIGLKF